MKCKHNWMWLLPDYNQVSDIVGLYVELMGDNVIKRSVICNICGATGHVINSNKSGIRLHTSEYFINKANELARKYNFKIGQRRLKPESKEV